MLALVSAQPLETTFGDWLAARMAELELSTRDVERACGLDEHGRPRVTHSSVHRYMRGQHDPSSMSEDVLKGLAKALRTPERIVRELAGRPVVVGVWKPPAESRYLSVADRVMLDALVRRLVEYPVNRRPR